MAEGPISFLSGGRGCCNMKLPLNSEVKNL